MLCPSCGHENREGRVYCAQCGSGLVAPWRSSDGVLSPAQGPLSGDRFALRRLANRCSSVQRSPIWKP